MEYPRSKTLGDLLDEISTKLPKQEGIIFKNERYSYQKFRDEADQIGKSLIELGLRKGEKVGALINNRLEWLTLAFGVAKAGGVFVPLSTFYRTKEIEYALKNCDIKLFFTVDRFLGFDYLNMVKEILPDLDRQDPDENHFEGFPDLKHVISIGEQAKGTYSWQDFLGFGCDVSGKTLKAAQDSVGPKDLAFILLTSGTTAHPKAVQLLHDGLVEKPFAIGERMHLSSNDRLWVGIPVFFSWFNANAMGAIMTHGGTFVIQEYFDPSEVLLLIEKEKCTVVFGFYNMISALLSHNKTTKRNIGSVRTGETIGTPEQIKLMAELVPQMCNVYGCTEVYGISHMTDSYDPLELRCRCSGKILPGFEMKVVDEAGKSVTPGEIGEACFKGYVSTGYYKDPENKAIAFDEEGWFRPGDLVIVDRDGYLSYVNRKKDMIKTGGINVSPATVEDYLMSHPKIREVHVIGYPDKVKDEVVMAVIELKEGEESTKAEIIQYCKGKIAGYSIPTYVYFIKREEWPLTHTGKVPKRKLKVLMLEKFSPDN